MFRDGDGLGSQALEEALRTVRAYADRVAAQVRSSNEGVVLTL